MFTWKWCLTHGGRRRKVGQNSSWWKRCPPESWKRIKYSSNVSSVFVQRWFRPKHTCPMQNPVVSPLEEFTYINGCLQCTRVCSWTKTQKKSNLFSAYQNTKIIQNNVYKTTSLKLIIVTHRLYICLCVVEQKVLSVYEKQTVGHNILNNIICWPCIKFF